MTTARSTSVTGHTITRDMPRDARMSRVHVRLVPVTRLCGVGLDTAKPLRSELRSGLRSRYISSML